MKPLSTIIAVFSILLMHCATASAMSEPTRVSDSPGLLANVLLRYETVDMTYVNCYVDWKYHNNVNTESCRLAVLSMKAVAERVGFMAAQDMSWEDAEMVLEVMMDRLPLMDWGSPVPLKRLRPRM